MTGSLWHEQFSLCREGCVSRETLREPKAVISRFAGWIDFAADFSFCTARMIGFRAVAEVLFDRARLEVCIPVVHALPSRGFAIEMLSPQFRVREGKRKQKGDGGGCLHIATIP